LDLEKSLIRGLFSLGQDACPNFFFLMDEQILSNAQHVGLVLGNLRVFENSSYEFF
jgi:hypothetical protein